MKISFNSIPYLNKINEGKKQPSFRSADIGEDKFIKSSSNNSGIDDYIAFVDMTSASRDLFDSIDIGDPELKLSIFKKIHDEAVLEGIFSAMASDDTLSFFKKHFSYGSVKRFAEIFPNDPILVDTCFEYFDKAKIKTCPELISAVEMYSLPRVNKVYDKATLNFFEIYGQLNDRNDMRNYPELLLHLNDLFNDETPENLSFIYSSFTGILKLLDVKNIDEFKEKFKHLAPDFNDFSSIHDIGLAMLEIQDHYGKKIDLLAPFVSGNSYDERSDNACKLYSSMPDIIDALYKENNGKSLGDFNDYFSLLSSSKDLSKKGISLLKPYFNDFSTPKDKLRFFRLLSNNGVSINNFKKLYSKQIISDIDPLPLIYNKPSIAEFISQKEKMNESNASSIYFNFPEIFNVAYLAENSSDILSETYSLIKNCRLKSSSDVLDFYNQCNIPNGKAKTLTQEQFVDFIDLMKFVNKDDFKDLKKVKKIRLDDLRKTRQEFEIVKDKIENFLLNNSKNLFLHQTPLSIFNTYKSELIGATDAQIETFLFEIDRFNIKNDAENRMKNFEIDRLQNYFPTRKDVLSFVILNEISFDNAKEDEEYKLNCNKILKALYRPYAQEESFDLIKKLSDSKFLINSKNSLNDLLNRKLDVATTYNLIDTLLDKQVKSYNLFENFVREYEVDEKSFGKLVEFIKNTPDDITFGNVLFQLRNLKFELEKSGFPLTLTADNLSNLSYDDLLNFKTPNNEIDIKILNKLLGLSDNQSPVLSLPNVYTDRSQHDRFKIAFELLNVKAGSDSYPLLIKFLFGKNFNNVSHSEIKKCSYEIPEYFIDFVNSKFKAPNGKDYNMSLHSKLRIIERFLMEDIETQEDFISIDTYKKLDSLLNSIYNKEQLMFKNSVGGERILFNSIYNGKVIETVFNKSGVLVTAVEKSYR